MTGEMNDTRLIRCSEAARMLGYSLAGFYGLLRRGEIPFVRMPNSKTIRISASVVAAIVNSGTKSAADEPSGAIA